MNELESHLRSLMLTRMGRKKKDVPRDYFNWGRDPRHIVERTERLPVIESQKKYVIKTLQYLNSVFCFKNLVLSRFHHTFAKFEKSYLLMTDQYSKNLFAELILMKLVTEKNMGLSSFTKEHIASYERASDEILNSAETLAVYKWLLRRVKLKHLSASVFTTPILLNLYNEGRLYRYQRDDVTIEVEGGDTVIDAGVGWGDTTIYLGALAQKKPGGHSYAFDVLEEGMRALDEQMKINPHIDTITPVLKALSDVDNEDVYISAPSPGARIVRRKTQTVVKTCSIDSFYKQNNLKTINFIKMDIEGAEVPALKGAKKVIKEFKPKLAISVYHKWDDLLVIPQLIADIRDDYSFYLDCSTGFGGEIILYCR